jgi:hypothetical protein
MCVGVLFDHIGNVGRFWGKGNIESVSNGHVYRHAIKRASKDSVISFSSPNQRKLWATKIEGIEEVRESRNDSYYTKHKQFPNHVITNQPMQYHPVHYTWKLHNEIYTVAPMKFHHINSK